MTEIPTKAAFQKATDLTMVTSGKRPGDFTLLRIDDLIELYHAIPADEKAMRTTMLGRLYYATDQWLKLCDRGNTATINARRRPAVLEFYKCVVENLCEATKVPVNSLPRWLIETFGKAMGAHGAEVDLQNNAADYNIDKSKYELVFQGGLVYTHEWWVEGSTNLVLANTELRNEKAGQVIKQFFGGYVVSLGGDFYSGPHNAGGDNKQNGRFHSSYLAGESIMCAGELRIKDGKLIEINTESGHYQPGVHNIALAVQVLAGYGVNLDTLTVKAFGQPEANGRAFLKRFDAESGTGNFKFTTGSSNTHLSRHGVKSAIAAHQKAIDDKPKLELLKTHWVRVKGAVPPNAGHGVAQKDKCQVCKGLGSYWPVMEYLASHTPGGLPNVVISAMAPAKLAAVAVAVA